MARTLYAPGLRGLKNGESAHACADAPMRRGLNQRAIRAIRAHHDSTPGRR